MFFEKSSFGALGSAADGTETLDPSHFVARADNLAQDANDRFIFRTTDHTLWFDADGNGSANAVQIAVFSNRATLTADDLYIFG